MLKRLRNLAIIDVMLYSGLRVAEVEELKVEDVIMKGDVKLTIREGKNWRYTTAKLVGKYSKNLRNWLRQRQTFSDEIRPLPLPVRLRAHRTAYFARYTGYAISMQSSPK